MTAVYAECRKRKAFRRGEIVEAFISGFCRSSNETRTVACEYERREDGTLKLTEFDCNYETCPNHAACLIYKEAAEREDQGTDA